jgi:hypothetical protein
VIDQKIDLIIERFIIILENEFNFLNKMFSKECKTINNIRKEAFYEFIKMKINERFAKFNLGISNSFNYDQDLSREVFSWFFHLVSGNIVMISLLIIRKVLHVLISFLSIIKMYYLNILVLA